MMLSDYLRATLRQAASAIEDIPEDVFLSRSVGDVLAEAVGRATCGALTIDTEPVDGGVEDFVERTTSVLGVPFDRRSLRVWAAYRWQGNEQLFWCRPSSAIGLVLEASVETDTIVIEHIVRGVAVQDVSLVQAKTPLDQTVGRIANMVVTANGDAVQYNDSLELALRPVIEDRRGRILARRNLVGQLGFPVERRADPPVPVPVERRVLGVERYQPNDGGTTPTYQDEYAIDLAAYEDVLGVIVGMLRAFERTPSVATVSTDEEFLRDVLLVSLNGTFKGTATGETFVKKGKTDILVRVGDRHVFVGECKWWRGAASLTDALNQLLGYLPWRDEKAALVVFIDQVDTTAILDKAETAVREHSTFKRAGSVISDPAVRRDFVLGHPDDPIREIRLAVLFAVIHNEAQ
jgi:hypothetical protein